MPTKTEATSPRISVVIPARDHEAMVVKLVASIQEGLDATESVEIIVVDDGSRPPLSSEVFPQSVVLVRLEESQGPAFARNEGAARAQGDILFFMDADVLYATGAFEAATKLMDAEENLVGISYCNQRYAPSDGWVANFGAVTERYYERDMLQGADVADIRALSSRNGAVRLTGFQKVEGFDPAYRTNAHEDYDFGKRLAAIGRLVILKEPVLYHAFPSRITKVLRNYWVRTSLFIPYALKYKPPMDPVQISYGEAQVRALPLIMVAASILWLCAIPFPGFWMALSLLAGALYLGLAFRFLKLCREASGSWAFTACALGLHFFCSLAVCAGGIYGLVRFLSGANVPEPRSTLH